MIQDAAAYLDVSASTLRRWEATGKLVPVRHPQNRYRYYKRSQLEPLRLDYTHAELEEPHRLFSTAIAKIDGNKKLRDPQQEAHSHVRKHFATSDAPAILQIPVGCGKTGVMATLPFGVAKGRVLVIVPNTTIRDGVASALNSSSARAFLRKAEVLSDFSHGPFRAILDGPNANLSDCADSHFVVANIQQLASRADRWLPQFPDDFFDMILVDEGHHNAAQSWTRVFERFPKAKVVSLTATPFRSDGKRLLGEVIYRYSYTQAMLKGYIKRLHAINASPQEIYFTYRGDERRHTLEEVLALREEAWFRRGVALAPECNRHIVDASIHRCLKLREKTGLKHQVIAAACSVDHARQVEALYEQRNFSTRCIHSKMPAEEQEAALLALRSRKIDCIVQVQMLGEGFDHPPLSVGAIFRPYRSLSPFIQFVGRIMRVVHQGDPEHPDNNGYIVSHVGLNNDTNWADFREIDLDDQAEIHRWLTESDTESSGSGEGGHGRRFDGGMAVADEVISHFITQSYLDPNDDRVLETILNQKIPGTPFTLSALVSKDELKARMLDAQKELEQAPVPIIPQPQDVRRTTRRRVNQRSRSVAKRVLDDLHLGLRGREVSRAVAGAGGKANLDALVVLMSRAVNEYLGVEKGGRSEVPGGALQEVYDQLDALGDQVRDEVAASISENK